MEAAQTPQTSVPNSQPCEDEIQVSKHTATVSLHCQSILKNEANLLASSKNVAFLLRANKYGMQYPVTAAPGHKATSLQTMVSRGVSRYKLELWACPHYLVQVKLDLTSG